MTLKNNFIKFCRYAPPLVTQIATFVATRALATEYEDYGKDRGHIPLGAKITLIAITLLSALTGLVAVVGTWKTSDKSRKVKSVDVVLQVVAIIIAIVAGSSTITDHNALVTAGLSCAGPNARVCLPAASECSDTSKPPCDVYVDTDKLVADAKKNNLNYENHFGWIDQGDKYRTVQYAAFPPALLTFSPLSLAPPLRCSLPTPLLVSSLIVPSPSPRVICSLHRYQSYGDISEGWGYFSKNGECSEYRMSTTTASFDKTNYSAAGLLSILFVCSSPPLLLLSAHLP